MALAGSRSAQSQRAVKLFPERYYRQSLRARNPARCSGPGQLQRPFKGGIQGSKTSKTFSHACVKLTCSYGREHSDLTPLRLFPWYFQVLPSIYGP